MSQPTTEMLLTVERARNADLQERLARLRRALDEAQSNSADELLRYRAQYAAARKEIARKETYIKQLHRMVEGLQAELRSILNHNAQEA